MNQSAESVSLFFDNRRCYAKSTSVDSVFKVDWPMVLGNMYNKYNKFKLVVNSYTCIYYAPRTNTPAIYSNHMALKMTGLNFINSCSGGSPNNDRGTDNVITGISNNEATLQIVDTGSGAPNVSVNNIFGSDGDSVIFNRPSSSPEDITFMLRDYRNNGCPPSFFNTGNTVFIFTIGCTIYGLYD